MGAHGAGRTIFYDLGIIIAIYSAVAYGTRRAARLTVIDGLAAD